VIALHVDKGLQKEIGKFTIQMKDILNAELKKTPQAVVRVCDQYITIKDESDSVKGLARCLLYLEDLGELTESKASEALPA